MMRFIVSQFVWLGNNAVAAWGFTNFWDGLDGNQSYNTSLLYNLCLLS